MRKRGRTDANQEAIVKALRNSGCSVQSLASCGTGVPDLLVGIRDKNVLLEVKDGTRAPSARKLTPAQVAWHKAWRGKVQIVTTPIEALEAVLGSAEAKLMPMAVFPRQPYEQNAGQWGQRLHVSPPGSKIK